jgi:hypothetical protein
MALGLTSDPNYTFTVSDADLVDSGDTDTTFTLRHITTEQHQDIVDRHTKETWTKRHQKEKVYDHAAIQRELLDFVLVAWSGVVMLGTHTPIPCEIEAKLLLDVNRKMAIIERAGGNEIVSPAEAKADSFRPTPRDGDLVGGSPE